MNRWWNRLIFRMPALIVLVTLIPLLAFGTLATRMSTQSLTREVGRANRAVAIRVVELIEATIADTQEDITIAVNSPEFSGMEYETQELSLQSLSRILHDVKALTVVNERGYEQVKFSREKVFLAEDLTTRLDDEEFQQAIRGQAYVGPVHTTGEGIPMITLAVPIWNRARDGTVGVLMAEVSLRGLLDEVVKLQIGESGYVFIVDGSGKVIAHPDFSLVLAGEDFSDQPHIQHFQKGEPTDEAHIYTSHDGVEVIGVGTDTPNLGWIVIVEQPVEEALAASRMITRGLTYTLGITLFLAIAIVGYTLIRLIRPLQNLERGVGFIGKGDLDYRIEVKSKDEIGKLARAFNEMAANLQESLGVTAQSQRLLLAFSQIAQQVLRARSLGDVYKTISDEVNRLGYSAAVFVLSEDKSHLTIPYLGYESSLLKAVEKLTGLEAQDYRFSLDPDGYYQDVIDGGQAVFTEPFIEPIMEAVPDAIRAIAPRIISLMGIKQGIVAPLICGDEPFGILVVTGNSLTKDDLMVITGFANQTTIALENVRLYEQLQGELAERVRAEIALRAYTAKLEQSNRDLEEFTYIASHDLQEPLRKILAFGDRLATKYEQAFDDVGRDYLT
ncbi:MAG: HAMP domain-containing protein [Anaerolineales bacterium]|nr:HAMP domain-containing protein [Anaerolineales bacterium]